MKKIQMVDLRSQYEKIKIEIDGAIQEVIDQTAFINGAEVKLFAEELRNYLNCGSVVTCGNGTDGLQIALMVWGFKPGSEVIVPAFTYIAAVEVIALLGLKPVFVDVDPDTFQIDASKIEEKISRKTVAIIPVHLFGQCADMESILEISKHHGLKIIEDAAQSIGSTYTFTDQRKVQSGTMGDIGVTSFFPSKNLGCFGDGGAMLTNSPDLAEKLRMITGHGQKRKYFHESIGVNSRLDTLQAGILRKKLPLLGQFIQARNNLADAYDRALNNNPYIQIPQRERKSTHVFHQYTIKVSGGKRKGLTEFLASKGIPSMIYYPMPAHLQQAYRYLGYGEGDFPVSETLCQEVLSLPMHTEMEKEQIEYIIESIQSYFE